MTCSTGHRAALPRKENPGGEGRGFRKKDEQRGFDRPASVKHDEGIRVHSRDLWPHSAVCEDYAGALGSVSATAHCS